MTDSPLDLNIFVIAPNPLARMGLVAMLAQTEHLNLVGHAPKPSAIDSSDLDGLLWDFSWNPESACEELQILVQEGNLPPVVVLLDAETDARSVYAAGASGFLSQSSTADQIYAALLVASQGLVVFEPDFNLIPPLISQNEAILTAREHEVLQLLASGLPNKVMARQLGVSDHTIKFHVNAIMTKLEAQSRTEAVVKGMKLGLVIL